MAHRGDYDRPIPRRILEEAGVPRRAFGIKKMASAQAHFYKKDMQLTALRDDYITFMKRRSESVNSLKDSYWKARHRIRTRKIKRLAPKEKQYVAYTPLRKRFSFQYCFHALKGRYRVEHSDEVTGENRLAE